MDSELLKCFLFVVFGKTAYNMNHFVLQESVKHGLTLMGIKENDNGQCNGSMVN